MDKEKVKKFAKEILQYAEAEELTVEEVMCLPRLLEWEINDSMARDRQGQPFKYNNGLNATKGTEI